MIPEKKYLDQSQFLNESQNCLHKTKNALEEIQENNVGSILDVQHSAIKFEYQSFTLFIERNLREQLLQVMVGNGITHNYFFEEASERWVSTTDGHLMDELICREITSKCSGYFNI